MKKIGRSSELLWVFGIVFVALGVAICGKADLGVSMIAAPAFVFHEWISSHFAWISLGVTEYVIQGLILVIMCVAVRRFNPRYLLAFLVAVIYGYTLDLFMWLLGGVHFDSTLLRWVMLIVGDLITAFGVACFFRTYMPLQVYELFVAEVASVFKFSIAKTKQVFDISLLVFSIAFALILFRDVTAFDWSTIGSASFHSLGLGTIVTTLINSPLIALMGKIIDRIFDPTPVSDKLYRALKRS